MSTERNLTPEGFRTAAYLEARARMDAGKTRRNVQCTPPNKRCGNRCIPPNWDCRLKGEGPDPHLRAVKTDPLGGLANIQRGTGRIIRGIAKGSFSDVEGGKRSVIRGAVKIAPGDLNQKKELQKKLEDRTRSIGIGLAVITGGLGIHALLMKTDTFGYRDGLGADINHATRMGVNKILDATPIIGANRARTRARVASGLASQLERQHNPVSAALTNQLARTPVHTGETESRTLLVTRLQKVDEAHSGASADFYAWDKAHQKTFWSTTKKETGVGLDKEERASVFARPATEEFLARQFKLQGDDVLTTKSIKDAIERQMDSHKSDLLDLARQQGFAVKNVIGGGRVIEAKQQRAFIQGLVKKTLPPGTASETVRSQLTKHIEDTLKYSSKTRTDNLYRDTFKGFNDFYTSQASITNRALNSPKMTPELRRAGAEQTILDGRQARAQYVIGRTQPGKQIKGSAHAEVALRDYHARVVRKTPRNMFTITDRLAIAAASEIEGRTVNKKEAFQILEREGFTGIVSSNPPSRTRERPQTEGEAVYELMRQNPGMGLAAARREIKRRRKDSDDLPLEVVRASTYLVVRQDLRNGKHLGKPCGESHIPKTHECTKGVGTSNTSDERKKKAAIAAAVIGGAALVAIAGATAYDVKNLQDPSKSPMPPSPSIKDLAKQMKKEAGTKSASEAMGHYYTKKSGLKPGDVVYFRHEKDPAAHFGIYLGEGKDGVVRAVIANTKDSRFSWADVSEIGSTKPGGKAAQALMTPLMKAPTPQFADKATKYTNEEVVRRAIRIAGTDYKFSLTRDNCEALANGIAYGVPESEQLKRFKVATRAAVDVSIGRNQRREGKRAIYEGRAQGRNYTAKEFVSFLEGQREFSSYAGKELAQQYAHYFKDSRVDQEEGMSFGLVTPEALWEKVKSYSAPIKARAMADYLLIQRSLAELANGPD